jgi:RNA polymerase sigma-70 factor (ECF subfamily)
MTQGEVEREVARLLEASDAAAAASVIVRELGPQILGYLGSVLHDRDDADDAFARWAEAVWSGIGGFRGEAALSTWCHRVAYHAALRVLRDPFQRRRAELPTSQAAQLAAQVRSVTASHLGTTAQDRVAELRRALSPEDQTLLVLRLDRELPWRDVATVLAGDGVDVSEAALRKRYERVKERVRQLAVEAGLLPKR